MGQVNAQQGRTAMSDDLLVLTGVVDSSDTDWDVRATVVGTWEQVNAVVDLSKGIPFGWRLLRGKQARRFLKRSIKAESRYQREQAASKAAGGPN